MKDMILAIKAKAIDLDLDADYITIENQLFELKEKIRVLECFLDLKMLE